jgi:hypothetical protein
MTQPNSLGLEAEVDVGALDPPTNSPRSGTCSFHSSAYVYGRTILVRLPRKIQSNSLALEAEDGVAEGDGGIVRDTLLRLSVGFLVRNPGGALSCELDNGLLRVSRLACEYAT